MCHNFFIQSSVDWHLGCFHVLAIVNSATMSTRVHMTFFFLKKILIFTLFCFTIIYWFHSFLRANAGPFSSFAPSFFK